MKLCEKNAKRNKVLDTVKARDENHWNFRISGKNTGLGKKFILMQGYVFLKLWKMNSVKVFVE